MDKELVKVGMKVINKHGNIMTIVRHHISEPEKVDGVNRNGVYVVDVYICDIEPYEEPKENNGTYSTSDPYEIAWMKRMCATNKEEREKAENDLKELLNLPKEETTIYQVKDLEGNVIEEKVVEEKCVCVDYRMLAKEILLLIRQENTPIDFEHNDY